MWFVKFNGVIQEFGMTCVELDQYVFYQHAFPNPCIYFVVKVYDIVFMGNDLSRLKYFIGINIAQSQLGSVRMF